MYGAGDCSVLLVLHCNAKTSQPSSVLNFAILTSIVVRTEGNRVSRNQLLCRLFSHTLSARFLLLNGNCCQVSVDVGAAIRCFLESAYLEFEV